MSGRVASPNRLSQAEPVSRLGPSGFDPARGKARTHLIWSNKWGAWHKRCEEDGCARGYTKDILRAGVFETATAMEYDDEDRNKAVPIADAVAKLRAAVDEKRLELMAAQAVLVDFYNHASCDTHPEDGDATQIVAPLVSGAVPNGETPPCR